MTGLMLAVVLSVGSANLEVTFTGLRNDRGEVRVAVFAQPDGWPEQSEKAVRRAVVKIVQGRAEVTFEGLEPGRYAVVAFHDEDSNGKLNRGVFGQAKEGWAASNGARGAFGPSFEAATFAFTASASLELKVGY
jgi:uncharacterized protein (DUF2141 family)